MSKEKISGIYCIENLINGKKYIGQSCDIYARWYNHTYCLNNNRHDNSYLQNAWNKYGENNFKFYILEACDSSVIDDKEVFYISKYDSVNRDIGYNQDSGGNLNKHHSAETKEKIRIANTGKTHSDETREKISKNRNKISNAIRYALA